MNKKIKYIIISLIAILIITIAIIIVIKYNESKETVTPIEEPENTSEENVMVIGINTENTTSQEEQKQPENNNKPEEPTKEPNQEPEQTRDASALTQEIYNMNTTIGTLYIPKTNKIKYKSILQSRSEKDGKNASIFIHIRRTKSSWNHIICWS